MVAVLAEIVTPDSDRVDLHQSVSIGSTRGMSASAGTAQKFSPVGAQSPLKSGGGEGPYKRANMSSSVARQRSEVKEPWPPGRQCKEEKVDSVGLQEAEANMGGVRARSGDAGSGCVVGTQPASVGLTKVALARRY